MEIKTPDILEISIVIPVRDEEGNILPLAKEICSVMQSELLTWECIWVDDGSTDGTLTVLRDLCNTDPRHRYISFEHNAGQSCALWAGFSEARGALIATMDGDGQNDPADIPPLFRMVKSGASDMANGYRANRQDGLKRKISSIAANGFRNWMTGKTVRDVGCSTRVFRRACVQSLPPFSGMHRFLPTLVALNGYKLAEVPVNHRPRLRGSSKYSIGNRLWIGLLDTFGVFWLQKRALRYTVKASSELESRQCRCGTLAPPALVMNGSPVLKGD